VEVIVMDILRAIAVAITVMVVGAGCQADTSGLASVSVGELAELRSDASVVVCDANGTATRDKFGIIPGAVLLSSSSEYDIAAELPGNKAAKMIFYCSSTMCSAAPKAARRAVEAGYSDVAVLPVGIKGWTEAGQPVDKPSAG
jgi:rhodanese-related sulfurtransferase